MENLKENLWVIEYLTTEALIKRPHHFKELFRLCKISGVEPNEEMSF